MMRRCYQPTHKQYRDYGGRGISVCADWHNPQVFIAARSPRPPNTQMDRINNNGNYEPGNVRWATRKQNMLNRRVCYLWTLDDERIGFREISDFLAIPYTTLHTKMREALR